MWGSLLPGSTLRSLLKLGFWSWVYPLSHTWLLPTVFFEKKGAPLYLAGLFGLGAVMGLGSLDAPGVGAGKDAGARMRGALILLYAVTWLLAR